MRSRVKSQYYAKMLRYIAMKRIFKAMRRYTQNFSKAKRFFRRAIASSDLMTERKFFNLWRDNHHDDNGS